MRLNGRGGKRKYGQGSFLDHLMKATDSSQPRGRWKRGRPIAPSEHGGAPSEETITWESGMQRKREIFHRKEALIEKLHAHRSPKQRPSTSWGDTGQRGTKQRQSQHVRNTMDPFITSPGTAPRSQQQEQVVIVCSMFCFFFFFPLFQNSYLMHTVISILSSYCRHTAS